MEPATFRFVAQRLNHCATAVPFLKSHLNIILPSTPGCSEWSLSLRFPHQNTVYTSPRLYPKRATCLAYLILLDLITRIMFGEERRPSISSLCSFLHYPAASSLLCANILLSTLFSNTLSLRSFLSVSDKVSHPYQTTGKIIVVCILIFIFLYCWKTKVSRPKDSKHSLTSLRS